MNLFFVTVAAGIQCQHLRDAAPQTADKLLPNSGAVPLAESVSGPAVGAAGSLGGALPEAGGSLTGGHSAGTQTDNDPQDSLPTFSEMAWIAMFLYFAIIVQLL